ncbi:MAG: alpha/beta hydrolase [Polyangiales bacterium]
MTVLRSARLGIAYQSRGPGEGPVVLCLHGFPDVPQTWDSLGKALADDGFRVVSPWLPGYSPSSTDGPLNAVSVADRLLSFVDELSPDAPAYLVGHDWGALCAYPMLARAPDRFRAASLLAIPHPLIIEQNAPDHPKQLLRSSYIAFFLLRRVAERLIRLRNFALVERLWRLWSPGFEPNAEHLEAVKRCLEVSMPAPLEYYRALSSPKFIREFRRVLDTEPIPVPTLYLHGERDGCMAADIAKGQSRYFSALFETIILTESGHFLHLERPEEVNRAIRTWFQKEKGDSPL